MKKSKSEIFTKGVSAVSGALMILFAILNRTKEGPVFLTLAITAGTICYHFTMRLMVGMGFYYLVRKPLNHRSKWFSPKKYENRFYARIRIKKWKNKLPTYFPQDFSLKKHTREELIQTMCISEIGHELMIVLNFIPLLFAIPFGEFPVFLITSILGGCVDAVFAMTQRFNRFRLENIKTAGFSGKRF